MAIIRIKTVRVGTRTIAGTDWPITDALDRVLAPAGARWQVTRGICNGTAESAEVYRTKREALAALGEES